MKPTTEALQVFYGTIPLILAFLAVWLREQTLVKDILGRLGRIETTLTKIQSDITGIRERLATLEERDRLTHPVLKG
jgi:hypothetical protein